VALPPARKRCGFPRLKASTYDKTARIWDVDAGAEILQLVGHTDTIKGAVFTPDGRYVVTGGSDGTARLWDATTGAELRRFSGHTGIINSVAVSADSRFICTASGDRTARLWALDYRQTIGDVCKRLARDLTPAERAQFNITTDTPTCGAAGI
jgi:WD40 repeat protein